MGLSSLAADLWLKSGQNGASDVRVPGRRFAAPAPHQDPSRAPLPPTTGGGGRRIRRRASGDECSRSRSSVVCGRRAASPVPPPQSSRERLVRP